MTTKVVGIEITTEIVIENGTEKGIEIEKRIRKNVIIPEVDHGRLKKAVAEAGLFAPVAVQMVAIVVKIESAIVKIWNAEEKRKEAEGVPDRNPGNMKKKKCK